MSYILDALTKAAQQRDRHAPVVQRLLSPAPRPGSPWTRSSGRWIAALALNAALLTGLLVWWLRPVPVPVVAPTDPAATAAPATATPPRPGRLEALPRTDVQVEKAAPPMRDTSTDSAARAAKPRAQPPAPPASPRPAAPTAQPVPAPTVAPPVASAGPPSSQERARLRLEALIYADVPAQRMVFINGRRYGEGDVIDGRLRVEEIQEDGVELSDQGRRFTLRVAR